MADKVVDLGDGRVVSFPDSMPDDQVSAAIKSQMGTGTAAAKPASLSDSMKNFFQNAGAEAWDSLKGLANTANAVGQALNDPRKAIQDASDESKRISDRAQGYADQGDYSSALQHSILSAIPLLGPHFSDILEQSRQGDLSGALGRYAPLATSMAAPEVLSELGTVSKYIPAAVKTANPKVANAAATAMEEGVPLGLGAITDNRFLKGAQELSDSTPLGAVVNGPGKQSAAFLDWANREARRAAPDTPVGKAYGDFDRAAADPNNVQTVKIGEKPHTYVNPDTYEVVNEKVPVTKDMALPVRVADLKPMAQKFIEDRQLWSPAQKQSNPAYAAAQEIANGPDYVPAKTAEIGLSALKNDLRQVGSEPGSNTGANVLRGQTAGLGKLLQQAIDRDVGAVDPAAAASLRAGRSARAQQAGADWLNQAFSNSNEQGAWGGAQGLWRKWQNLDDAEKATMFSPEQKSRLDDLFLAAKRAENVSSGSRTAPLSMTLSAMSGAGGVGSAFTGHPVLAALSGLTLGGPGVISKLMYDPRFVRAATQGLKVSATAPEAVIQATKIMRIAEGGKGGNVSLTGTSALPMAASNENDQPQSLANLMQGNPQ